VDPAAMVALDEMEPRIPLVEGAPGVSNGVSRTITITQSGSYYLTGNLSVISGDGIVIDAEGVTLDLRGFTIRTRTRGISGTAVKINAKSVSVFNGHVVSSITYGPPVQGDSYTGRGFEHGIHASLSAYTGIHIRDVSVSGCDKRGIYCESDSCLVESCRVTTVGSYGIYAGVVRNCIATQCGGTAVFGKLVDSCFAESTGNDGINAVNVADSYAYSSSTIVACNGIDASGCVDNCYGKTSGQDGIAGRVVSYSHGESTGGGGSAVGIRAVIAVGCSADGGVFAVNKYLMP